MKITCNRHNLLAACQLASAAVSPRDVKPVLRNIKAVAGNDGCTLTATDLELGVRLNVPDVQIEEPGEALLPANKVIAILREAGDEELTIEADPGGCTIRGQSLEFEMPGEDPSLFPDIPAFTDESHHDIRAGSLRELIRRTTFAAASAEHARFGATLGVLWEREDGQIALIATDGRRLARAEGPAQAHGEPSKKAQMPIVPVKALSLLDRLLGHPDEIVRVSLRPNEVLFKTEQAVIYSRLVEGRFPNYRQVVPQKHPTKIPLSVGPFLLAIRQAAVMTDDDSKRVTCHFAKKTLTLQARGADSGSARVELPLDYEGKPIEISFDPRFLLDMLRVMPPETNVTLELKDANTPAILRSGADYLYVVVPLVPTSQEAQPCRASA